MDAAPDGLAAAAVVQEVMEVHFLRRFGRQIDADQLQGRLAARTKTGCQQTPVGRDYSRPPALRQRRQQIDRATAS